MDVRLAHAIGHLTSPESPFFWMLGGSMGNETRLLDSSPKITVMAICKLNVHEPKLTFDPHEVISTQVSTVISTHP